MHNAAVSVLLSKGFALCIDTSRMKRLVTKIRYGIVKSSRFEVGRRFR